MKVPDTQENLRKCICMNCPTHNAQMKQRMLGFFCARGKPDVDLTRAGCICGECALSGEYDLSGSYYCDVGAAE